MSRMASKISDKGGRSMQSILADVENKALKSVCNLEDKL